MLFEKFSQVDIDALKELQPEGWSDISEEFRLYIDMDFCTPVKVILDGNIVGIGTSIVFENTGWLAHIIVKPEYRERGIGYQIVNFLISDLKLKHVETFLLIATAMGEPLYKKSGFKTISEYLFLNRVQDWNINPMISNNIEPYKDQLYDELVNLDKAISGENREGLIKYHLKDARVYMDRNKVQGAYLPLMGEGLIIANNSEIGIELMKYKYSKIDKAVIPAENKEGLDFLIQNGFERSDKKGKKMILGKGITWKPECYFSRIGGNFG